VYVKCPLEVAESRDPKGLYKKARAGEIKGFTGIDDPYEEPDQAELVIDTSQCSVEEGVAMILGALEKQNLLSADQAGA
jgi:adenylylsulfate kinase